MGTPFDPTTTDKREWERLAASKWLPPLVQKEAKNENSPSAKVSQTAKPRKSGRTQAFPHQEIRLSHQTKKKLMVGFIKSNVCSRFVAKLRMRALYLEELAVFLEEKERQDAESMERKWTLAKQLSKTPRFLNYIQMLEERGRTLDEKQNSPKIPEDFMDAPFDVLPADYTHVNHSNSIQKTLEHKSFYDLRNAVASSPFKPKEKSLKRTNLGIYEELTHDFSKPTGVSEDVIVEFGRAFRDIYQMGTIAKEKWSKAVADKKAFSIRRSNDHIDLNKSKNRVDFSKVNHESKKQKEKITFDQKQSPALKNSQQFNLLREEEHSKLLTVLENRKKDRFNRTKKLSTIQPVYKLIDTDMSKHTPRRENSIWRDTLPHLWTEDPYNHHLKVKLGKKPPSQPSDDIRQAGLSRNISFENREQAKIPTSMEVKCKLGWSKIRSVARFGNLKNCPRGPRNSISVQRPSELIRFEFKDLMEK